MGVNIPIEIVEMMDLNAGDSVAFFFNSEKKRVIIEKISEFVTPSGLSFSISKDVAKKILTKSRK